MTEIAGKLTATTHRLEAAIRKQVDEEAAAAIRTAEREASAIIEAARRAARQRLKQSVRKLRRERTLRVNRARARLATAEREWRQRLVKELLDEGMAMLREALIKRWHDVAARKEWCMGLARDAEDRLAPGRWTVEHPKDWSPGEQEALVAALTASSGNPPAFTTNTAIACGLCISSDKARLDGTAVGLLAQVDWIEAEMLALVEQAEPDETAAP
jgi:F0F1-type ATP synthase membrane subunit b/b'